MAPFDKPYATFYWSAIANIALSCIIFEFFDVEYYRDLEVCVRGHSRSLKVVPFESLDTVTYLPSIVTMTVSLAISETFSVKEWSDLNLGLGSFKFIENGAVRQTTYDFLLVRHCNYTVSRK